MILCLLSLARPILLVAAEIFTHLLLVVGALVVFSGTGMLRELHVCFDLSFVVEWSWGVGVGAKGSMQRSNLKLALRVFLKFHKFN